MPTTQMLIFVLFVSAGVLFDGAFSLKFCSKSYWKKQPFIFTAYFLIVETNEKRQKQPTLYCIEFLYWILNLKFFHVSIVEEAYLQ